jgi:hypothetical protein
MNEFDPSSLDSSKPLVLLLGNVDHEGILSALTAAGRQYKNKKLDSTVRNWDTIISFFKTFSVKAVIVKLSGSVYSHFNDSGYQSCGKELLSLIANVPNVVFVHESLLDPCGEAAEKSYFTPPPKQFASRVNDLLSDSGVNLVTYTRNAQVTTIATKFLADTENGLLFRMYVPSGRLWASEVDRLLQLFRDYLSKTGRDSVKLSEFRTANGTAFEFHGTDSLSKPTLSQDFEEFSQFLDLCVTDPSQAEDILREKKVNSREISAILSRYSKEAKRLQIDLKQDRERKILNIRHRLESELVDAIDLGRNWDLLEQLVDSVVPKPISLRTAHLLNQYTAPTTGPSNVTFNLNANTIGAVNAIIDSEIHGDANVSSQDRELLNLILKEGGIHSGELASAVHELSDKEIPQPERVTAAHKLKTFLLKHSNVLGELATGVLKKYIEHKLGL